MNFLDEVKKHCKEQLFAIYDDLSDELESTDDTKSDWETHYSQMGLVLFELAQAQTIPELIEKLLSPDLMVLGCETDEDIDELFTNVCIKMCKQNEN